MKFIIRNKNYIRCENKSCNNDTAFETVAYRVDCGIWDIRIKCSKCGWVSPDLCEYTGYIPDLSKAATYDYVRELHSLQNEKEPEGTL